MNEIDEFLKIISEGKQDYIQNDPVERRLSEVKSSISDDLLKLFDEMGTISSQIKIQEVVSEEVIEKEPELIQEAPVEDSVEKYVINFKNASFQQPDVPKIDPNIKAVQDKLKFLEQWIGKISAAGPGGGAGDIVSLDMPTKVVTTDYTMNRKDYYIGVNADIKVSITLPTSSLHNGKVVVIKDESGHANSTPIKIIGNIDNDPNGAEIRINNGAIQLIYRGNSWRVI